MDYFFSPDGNGTLYNGQQEHGLLITPKRFASNLINDSDLVGHFLSFRPLVE